MTCAETQWPTQMAQKVINTWIVCQDMYRLYRYGMIRNEMEWYGYYGMIPITSPDFDPMLPCDSWRRAHLGPLTAIHGPSCGMARASMASLHSRLSLYHSYQFVSIKPIINRSKPNAKQQKQMQSWLKRCSQCWLRRRFACFFNCFLEGKLVALTFLDAAHLTDWQHSSLLESLSCRQEVEGI